MLLGNNSNLENVLLITLSDPRIATVPAILVELKKQSINPSVQGVYRALRKLQSEGVVVKDGENYTIRIAWVLDMGMFIKNVEDKYLQSQYFKNLINIPNKEKVTWNFTSIFKLNDFWSQLAGAVVEASSEKILFNYHPHPWFYLIQTFQEYQYIKTSSSHLKKRYTIVGGQEYLDHWVEKFWQGLNIEYYFAPKQKWLTQDRTLNIGMADDFIWYVRCDENITKEIDNLYGKVKTPAELDIHEVMSIFQKKIKGKIIFQRNARLVHGYKQKFKRLFGTAS